MSKEDVLKRLESLGLIDKQLITEVFITMYTSSMKKDGFPICELRLNGIGKRFEADIVNLTVSLDGNVVKEAEIPVVQGDSGKYLVTVGEEHIVGLTDSTAECTVLAVDKYGRELVSSSSAVQFDVPLTRANVTAEVEFVDQITIGRTDIRTDIADIELSSDSPTSVCVELLDSGKMLWQSNINIPSGSPVVRKVSIDSAKLKKSESNLLIRIKCNGVTVSERSAIVSVIRESDTSEEEPAEIPNIVGDLVIPDYVDTHEIVNDNVSIGSLVLFNKGDESDVMISVSLDGSDLICEREHIDSEDKQLDIDVPFSKIASDDTHTCEMIAHVTDVYGNVLVHKISTLKIRSKYDMNLREIRLRTAQFVNPRNKAVMDLVNDSNSLLASSMSGRYMIQGYQNGGRDIVRQMEAAYLMMYNMNMRYVSDTFTFNKSSECYQHVRAPDKVLENRSGNCLELSILYASIMEAMGLETIIAFPPGHAIVGVVFATDIYETGAESEPDDKLPIVEIDVGDKCAFALFVEVTMCPFCNDFFKAASTAQNEIMENEDHVSRSPNHVFIKQMRLNGTDPIIGL
ncbi:hypothetical protein [Methanomethylophilus alvi]|uniref:hypothetical protein n=1 Tax=Methanomethylophilus alvi TaxID=1291540 RepID=UPI0037DC7E27